MAQVPVDNRSLEQKAIDFITNHGPDFLSALVVLVVGLWLIKIARRLLSTAMDKRELDPSLQPFLKSIIIISFQVLLIIGVMQIAGLQLTIFTTVIGAFGVAAGLALSGTLQNFASGVLILILKPFRVGDNIIAQGQEGIVHSIEIFYTVVTTFDNKTVIIPNSKLSNEIIINTSREGKRRLDVEIKVGYGTDFKMIYPVIEDTIKEFGNIMPSPAPRIGVGTLEGDGYKVLLNVWVPAHGFTDMKLKIQEKLIDKIKAAEIKLPGM
ncbi:mechanosensitive ion channel family protein [Desertivirga brevis]|uniref:mechanosensitive ion channel family protein n=1 Tax=Desertivirga brevis TaxID=2810310 RepID=UPI001A95B320|nr:mechanosensitive ion channel domain-containing protein [Pedobacter sp. SYSU D00873]